MCFTLYALFQLHHPGACGNREGVFSQSGWLRQCLYTLCVCVCVCVCVLVCWCTFISGVSDTANMPCKHHTGFHEGDEEA